jgi:hypothetical protein
MDKVRRLFYCKITPKSFVIFVLSHNFYANASITNKKSMDSSELFKTIPALSQIGRGPFAKSVDLFLFENFILILS